MRKKKIYVPLIVLFVLALALVSFYTTFAIADGAFPSAKFHIIVESEDGQPIQGATLAVYRKTGWFGLEKEISYEYPIQEFSKDFQPISQFDGLIKVSHISKEIEFRGPVFLLFWMIPIQPDMPDIVVVIQALSYKAREIEYTKLYHHCGKEPKIFDENPPDCPYKVVMKRES